MKNLKKLIGIISFVSVIGFAFTACDDDDGNSGNDQTHDGTDPAVDGLPSASSAWLGETLNLNGQVWTANWNDNTGVTTYTEYNGVDKTIYNVYHQSVSGSASTSINGGSGEIKNGQLTFSIGKPSSLEKISESGGILSGNFEWLEDLNNFKISNTESKFAYLYLQINPTTIGSYTDYKGYLGRRYYTSTTTSEDNENVYYIYVDHDVTIGADRTVYTEMYQGKLWTETTNAFNINLKAGWNALYEKYVARETATSITEEVTYSAANPAHLRWVLYEW